MILGDIEFIIKAQENGQQVKVISLDIGTFLMVDTLGIKLSDNNLGNYIVLSSLKELFFRKRKNKEIQFSNGFIYDGVNLPTELAYYENYYQLNSIAYLNMPELNKLPMGDKDDITGWNDNYFICIEDNSLYLGYTNLNDIVYHKEEFFDTEPQYTLLDYNDFLSKLCGDVELCWHTNSSIALVNNDKIHITGLRQMNKQQIAQWQYLVNIRSNE